MNEEVGTGEVVDYGVAQKTVYRYFVNAFKIEVIYIIFLNDESHNLSRDLG